METSYEITCVQVWNTGVLIPTILVFKQMHETLKKDVSYGISNSISTSLHRSERVYRIVHLTCFECNVNVMTEVIP